MIKETDYKLKEGFEETLKEISQKYDVPLEVIESISVDLSKRICKSLQLCLVTNRDLIPTGEGLF